jgi:hypothetical protein
MLKNFYSGIGSYYPNAINHNYTPHEFIIMINKYKIRLGDPDGASCPEINENDYTTNELFNLILFAGAHAHFPCLRTYTEPNEEPDI